MAIVQTYEIAEGRGVSGTARESLQYTRAFAVKIDDPATPMDEIAQAPGILLGSPHPDDPSVFATSFDCSVSDDLLLYTLNVTYQAPTLIDASTEGPGSGGGDSGGGGGGGYDYAAPPADTWSGSSSVAAVPISTDVDGDPINNTAGIPIPDLQADWAFSSLSLTRSFATAAEAGTALTTYTNTVNSGAWAGTPAGTWKCQGGSWQKQTQSSGGINLTYYSATFNFAYDARGWKLQQVMIGTMESTFTGLQNILDEKGSPVTDPVLLSETGTAQPKGPPVVQDYFVYKPVDFSYFGTPS